MGIGVPELLLLFLIVLVVFGTKRLRNIGGDLGGAIKSFRSAMNDGEGEKDPKVVKGEGEGEGDSSVEKQDKA